MSVLIAPRPEPEPPSDIAPNLAAALDRFLQTKSAPDYLRAAAEPWLAAQKES